MSLLTKLLSDVKGRKTYIVSIATALYGLLGIYLGQLDWMQATQMFLAAAGLASVRHAVK